MLSKLLCPLLLLFFLQGITQNDSIVKTNSIIFADIYLGAARINSDLALGSSFGLNYQFSKNLFTIRVSQIAQLQSYTIFVVPIIEDVSRNEEYALMYGRRWIDDDSSLSVSLGVSYNQFKSDRFENVFQNQSNHFGFPIEANIRWFKSSKKRVKIYGLLPVGRPTGLGGSFGFKFLANISKHSFFGFGLVYSFGFHKQY